MENLKVCVDLSDTQVNQINNVFNALTERKENLFNKMTHTILEKDSAFKQSLEDAHDTKDIKFLLITSGEQREKMLPELAIYKTKMWANGRILKVKFMEGEEAIKQKVIQYAKKWEDHANIVFQFVTEGDAEIRITFTPNIGSWSTVGTDALNVPQTKPTMNFGWFDAETPEMEFSRTVTHEFGHALGCMHEHQSPAAGINWKKEVVYDWYWRSQRWDRTKVDNNLFARFNTSEVTNSAFDKQSIMLYPIPKEFTNDGFSVGMNNQLSATDISFIKQNYPKPI